MPARRSRVDVLFTDRDGVRWRVYEFGYVLGRVQRYPIGTVVGLYRGFKREDGREPSLRAMLIAAKADIERARVLSPYELQRELDESEVWTARRSMRERKATSRP